MTSDKRALLESAIAYAGGTHTVDDVVRMVDDQYAQLWEGPHSVIVTTIDDYPGERVLHVFLAAGVGAEIVAMQDAIREWAVAQGCTKARLIGRKGWARLFARDPRWQQTDNIVLEQRLNGTDRRRRESADHDLDGERPAGV